jgi:hypothetical protein
MITIPTLCALALQLWTADAFWRGLLADQSNPQVARIADRIRGALVRMHDDDHGPIPSYR